MKTGKWMKKTGVCMAVAALACSWSWSANAADEPSYPTVSEERLLNAVDDDGWLMYRRDYSSRAYAPFDEINAKNVANLKPVWDFESQFNQGHESPPVVNGDYLFVTTPLNHLYAFNAKTGDMIWKYEHDLSDVGLKTVCCDVVNRGVALYEDKVYMATLDNYVIAFDGKSGDIVWKEQLMEPDEGYAMTVAPLIVKGKVVVGVSGGEYGARGFVEALDAKTGKKAWKTYTVPAPDEPGGDTWPDGAYKTGGGAAWLTGTYDAETDSLFWGVGNPGPWLATLRPGDNLYTDSVITMDPETGKIKWHYQYTPNDTWDYDGVNETVMVDIKHDGKDRKAIVSASRNGWFYAIDRTNGELIYAKPFVTVTSVLGPDENGKMTTSQASRPDVGKEVFTCPSFLGGKNWWPMAIDPTTQTAYFPAMHTCMEIAGTTVTYKAGLPFLGETFTVRADPNFPGQWGDVLAIDTNTGKTVWRHASAMPWNGAMAATAGGVVFSGGPDQHLYAFDSKTGEVLWKSPELASGVLGVPTTWKVDGKQYVSVWAGWGGATPIWGGDMAEDVDVQAIPLGGHLYVFSL